MMIELNFINILLILFVAKLIDILASKMSIWTIEKFFSKYIKYCDTCDKKYWENHKYCSFCGKELKYLNDDKSEIIIIEEDEE